uniref:Endonuclease/exonuclease/phosphatase domain-containing protein n=1 Tax=Rhizophagus irregularis (strain DAOM 181602 / DAOM 197198 / MUCL 43194) TaxID=747089 RepID=U9TTV8_RHIID
MEHTNLKLPAGLENQPFEPNIQYSYSKFNKNTKKQKNYNKPQNHKNINQYFQTPHNNDIYTLHSRNYIQEPHNEEDENMLNYIEHNIFNDNDTTEMASTSHPHGTPIQPSSQPHSQFIDYHKFGTINIQGGYNNKLNDILHFFTLHNYDILILSETGLHQHTKIDMDLNKTNHSTHSFPSLNHDNINQNVHIYTDNNGNTKGSGVSMIITDQLQKHIIKTDTFLGHILTVDLCFKGNHYIKFICCYLPANASEDKELIINCYKEIENILINAMHNHFECIVIGDLNISFDKMKKSNHYPIWRREIKTIFKNFDLKDVLKSFHERPSPTLLHIVINEMKDSIYNPVSIIYLPHPISFIIVFTPILIVFRKISSIQIIRL